MTVAIIMAAPDKIDVCLTVRRENIDLTTLAIVSNSLAEGNTV
jgi:hypothetical protein